MATNSPLASIEPRHIDAANHLHNNDPETAAVLAAAVRQAARKVTDLDRDDVASLAGIYAPALLNNGTTTSEAATVAVRRACNALRQDPTKDDAVPLDEVTDERGEPLARMVSPWTPEPSAPYRTTTADRIVRAATALDPRTATIAAACHTYEWKGGKPPAAAIRRALGLPPVTGRAGTAWTALLKEDAPAAVAALHDEYRDQLRLDEQGCEGWEPVSTYGLPKMPRRLDDAARRADLAAKVHRAEHHDDAARLRLIRAEGPRQAWTREVPPAAWTRQAWTASPARVEAWTTPQGDHAVTRLAWTMTTEHEPTEGPAALHVHYGPHPVAYVVERQAVTTERTQKDPRQQDPKPTSGPASQPITYRIVYGTPISTQTGEVLSLHDRHAVRDARPVKAYAATTARQERDDFDAEAAAEAARGRRLPGVSVDKTGAAVAPSGVSGAGSGTAKAATRKAAPRKASRTGGTGATIPTGPRR